jgi:hypothetical protein
MFNAGSATDTGTDSATDTGTDSATDTGTDSATDTGTDSATDTDTGSATDTDTDTGTSHQPVADIFSQRCHLLANVSTFRDQLRNAESLQEYEFLSVIGKYSVNEA